MTNHVSISVDMSKSLHLSSIPNFKCTLAIAPGLIYHSVLITCCRRIFSSWFLSSSLRITDQPFRERNLSHLYLSIKLRYNVIASNL